MTELTAAQKSDAAQAIYKTFCSTLDGMHWTYDKNDAELTIKTSAIGQDMSMPIFVDVFAEKQVVAIRSPMPFNAPLAMRPTVAQALGYANYSMLNGCFEFDQADGYIDFKMVLPFITSHISEDVCYYMIMLTCQMVDRFNDKLYKVVKGEMSLPQFAEFANS